MTALNITSETKKELRSFESWTCQLTNILSSIFWLLGAWVIQTTTLIGAVAILMLLTMSEGDISSITIPVFLADFKEGFIWVGAVSALITVVFGLPKRLKNVFKDIAQYRIERQKDLFKQANIVESVLIIEALGKMFA